MTVFFSEQIIIRLLILYVTHTGFNHIKSVIFKKYGYTVLYIMNYRCGEIIRKGMGTCRSFDLIRSIAKSRKSDQMSINCFASKTKGYDISVACCSWHLGSIKFKTSICHYWKPWLISLFHSSIHIRCKKCLFFALNNDLYNITENQLKCRIQSSSACTLRLVKLHIVSWHMK